MVRRCESFGAGSLFVFMLGVGIVVLAACAPSPQQGGSDSALETASSALTASMQAAQLSYADVAPIFKNNCAGCHSGGSAAGGLNLASYAGIKKGGASGAAIKPGDPKGSLLMKRVHGTIKPQMPLGGDPLPQAQRIKLEQWIDGGAIERAAGAKPTTSKPKEEAPTLPKPGQQVLYKHVQTIFAQRCMKCHIDGGQMGRAPEGLRLDSYNNVLNTGERAVIIPGNPEASKLIRLIKGLEDPRMPFNEPPLSSEQIRVITDWIRQGARDNSGNRGPMPVGVEVRIEGELQSFWQVDGIRFDAGSARIDKDPRPGDWVEIRGVVTSDGRIRATRIRRR